MAASSDGRDFRVMVRDEPADEQSRNSASRRTSPPPLLEAGRGDQFLTVADASRLDWLALVIAPPRFGEGRGRGFFLRQRGRAGRRGAAARTDVFGPALLVLLWSKLLQVHARSVARMFEDLLQER